MILTRRNILRGLVAMPAIVAASSLMPIRGIIMPLVEPAQTWRLYSGYPNLSEIVTTTLRNRSEKLVEILTRNNDLLANMIDREYIIKPVSWTVGNLAEDVVYAS